VVLPLFSRIFCLDNWRGRAFLCVDDTVKDPSLDKALLHGSLPGDSLEMTN